jgi:REP element-mobilizing transposase RayT
MLEHVHLLLYPTEREYSVSAILKAMKQSAARRALQNIRRSSPQLAEQLQVRRPDGRTSFRFWAQGGGYDRNVTDPMILSNIITYIEANPVRKGLSQSPGDWRWSSAAARNDVSHILPCDPVRI